jgi:hypothetical protein
MKHKALQAHLSDFIYKLKKEKMSIYLKKANLVFLSAILFLTSCKKDNDSPGLGGNNSRVVKYEITGNYAGKLTVIYNDNVNGNTVVNNVSLPFIKEITYPATVTGIGIGGQSSTPVTGAPGQTATIKIYSGGNVVKTASATAGSLGEITLPTMAHLF